MRYSLFIILAFISLFFISCKEKAIFDEVKEIDHRIWSFDEWVEFQPEITDSTQLYDIYFSIRLEKDYPFQNIYLRQKMSGPFLEERIDTLNIDLIDPSAKWKGNCNKNECLQNILLAEKIQFQYPGSYSIAFEQFTRKDKLPGILEIGLRISQHLNSENN